jgi:hypothetical protein
MKVCESDITNTILSLYKLDIESLVLIKYYNSKEKLELQYNPNNAPNCIDNIHVLTEGGFFVISIGFSIIYLEKIINQHSRDYRLYYSDFIEKLRDYKLNEIGI